VTLYAAQQLEDTSPFIGAPTRPPRSWFERPDDLADAAYLFVEESGRVFGRFYARNAPLLTSDGSYEIAQPSPTGYEVFHRQHVLTAEGDQVRVGAITLGGHGAAGDSRNIVAVVRVGDDSVGGWFAGALVPEATENDAALLRRSQLSGEWQEMFPAWWAAHGVEPGAGVELRALTAVACGKVALMKGYRGYLPTLDRADADAIEEREHKLRQVIRDALDEPPARAVDILRRWLDDEDRNYFRRRVEALDRPTLPVERVPSTTTKETRP
jgi:hypothetical protein